MLLLQEIVYSSLISNNKVSRLYIHIEDGKHVGSKVRYLRFILCISTNGFPLLLTLYLHTQDSTNSSNSRKSIVFKQSDGVLFSFVF